MALTQAVKQLQKEQKRLQTQLEQVDNALQALNSLAGNGRRRGRSANGRRKPRRHMSAVRQGENCKGATGAMGEAESQASQTGQGMMAGHRNLFHATRMR